MKYLLQTGDIHTIKEDKNFFLFSKKMNRIFQINEKQYHYLNQETANFNIDDEIEKTINKDLQSEAEKKVTKNLVININVRKESSFALILKTILDSYNHYNKIIIIFEMNYDSFYFIESIIKWINGYERIVILCRINRDEENVIAKFNGNYKRLRENSSIKIFYEHYSILNNFDKDLQLKSSVIKISPYLYSKVINENEFEKISLYLINVQNSLMFKKSLESELRIRPTDIISITDDEIIFTREDKNYRCNKCWAQHACFSNNFYKLFSSHPYICSINSGNCKIIKLAIEKNILESIINNHENIKIKVESKKIKVGSHVITHLNP